MADQDDNVIAMCVDCCSTIPDEKAAKDIFLQSGQNGVCPYCGGPVIVTYEEERDAIVEKRRNGGIV